MFELVAPDIAFVKDGVAGSNPSEEITAGQTGMPEFKVERMMGGNSVERIKQDGLVQGHYIPDKRGRIVFELAQIDIDALHDAVQEFFEFFHWHCSLWP
jgi:hypothetical protein